MTPTELENFPYDLNEIMKVLDFKWLLYSHVRVAVLYK